MALLGQPAPYERRDKRFLSVALGVMEASKMLRRIFGTADGT